MKNIDRIKTYFSKNNEVIFQIGIFLLAGILCFYKLGSNSLVLDEISTINISTNWSSMFNILSVQEGNMWIYSFLMFFWLKLGHSEFMIRCFSAGTAILTVPIFYKLTKEITARRTARIATILFVLNFYFVFYAQLARGYSLALLFVTLSSLFYIKFIKNSSSNRDIFLYSLFMVMAIYTHLLSSFILLSQLLALLIIPKFIKFKKIIISLIGISISLLPLIFAPSLTGGHQLDWLQKPPLVHLPMGLIMLGGDSILFTIVSCFIILDLLLKNRNAYFINNINKFFFLLLFLWAGFPIVFGYVFSWILKPIYEPESFNTSLPAFIILISIGLSYIKRKWLFNVTLVSLLLLSALRLGAWYSSSSYQQFVIENNDSRNWRLTADYVADNLGAKDAAIFYAYYIRPSFEYYISKTKKSHNLDIIEISSAQYALGGGTKLPEPNRSLLSNLHNRYNRLWLVLSYNDTSMLSRKSQWQEIEKEVGKYYVYKQSKKLNQIEVKLFERK